jgi:hypothetical protein
MRDSEPATPGREPSASAVSQGHKAFVDGVTKSGRRRRRHPVAEIKGGWTTEEDAKLKECVSSPLARSVVASTRVILPSFDPGAALLNSKPIKLILMDPLLILGCLPLTAASFVYLCASVFRELILLVQFNF